MWVALGRRAAAGVGVVVGVVSLTFLLLHLAPGDPAARLVGPRAGPAALAAARHALGLDQPLPVQYVHWVTAFARGDWGDSLTSGRTVRSVLAEAWPETARLVLWSLLLSYGLGILIGVVQTAYRDRWVDTALSITSVTLYALPGYWIGLMLVLVATFRLHALPAFGAAGLDSDLLSGWAKRGDALRHLVLPVLTLTLAGAGGAARFTRGALREVAREPYVTTARAKGLGPARVWLVHGLRNALGPVITLLGLSLPAVFSGVVFVEAVFAWPGLGRVLVAAVAGRDYPVVMAATAISALLVVAGNLFADLLAVAVDPRLRDARPLA